jgi:small subunit ribosomal protein S30e
VLVAAGKVHGSLARAGKVRGQTPKVAKQDKKKKPTGRAHKRMQYNRRFVTAGTPKNLTILLSICCSILGIQDMLKNLPIFLSICCILGMQDID